MTSQGLCPKPHQGTRPLDPHFSSPISETRGGGLLPPVLEGVAPRPPPGNKSPGPHFLKRKGVATDQKGVALVVPLSPKETPLKYMYLFIYLKKVSLVSLYTRILSSRMSACAPGRPLRIRVCQTKATPPQKNVKNSYKNKVFMRVSLW